MVKAIILYEQEPDSERYAEHVETYAGKVPGATFRHGKIFAAPIGDKRYAYYGEFEWPDMESFREGSGSEEFNASGRDAMQMGIPFHVYLLAAE
ncbi:MAG: hypothetical protein WD981_01975 [Gaiellaceae bacterium]